MKLKGQCAIITGANRGFGFEVAKQFLYEGAKVMLCARDATLLEAARDELKQLTNSSDVYIMPVDISELSQVEALAAEAYKQMGKIDILIANAGVYGPKGSIESIDWDEWSAAIDINLKGSVLSARAVLPYFKKQKSGKIIFLSGGGATKPMPYLSAYAVSKAAVVRFCETLAEEVRDDNIDVNAVAPGALNTRLLDEILDAGPEKVGKQFYEQSLKQKEQGGSSLELGAKLCVFLSSLESDGITGKLISAVWDPWTSLPNYLEDLKKTDIYTLRRIIPEDREKNWGVVV